MIVNEGFLGLLHNWLHIIPHYLSYRGSVIVSCTLFVAIDDRSMNVMSGNLSLPWVVRWTGSSESAMSKELKYGTSDYFKLMSRRLRLVRNILLEGINLCLIEVHRYCLQGPILMFCVCSCADLHEYSATDDIKVVCSCAGRSSLLKRSLSNRQFGRIPTCA